MMPRPFPTGFGFAVITLLAAAWPASAEDAALVACVNLQSGLVRVVPANTSCRSTEGRLAWATPDENVVRVAVIGGGSKTVPVPDLGTVTAVCDLSASGDTRVLIDGDVTFAVHIGQGAPGTFMGLSDSISLNPVTDSLGQILPSNLWATILRTDIGVIWKVEVTLQRHVYWLVEDPEPTIQVIPCAATALVTRMN